MIEAERTGTGARGAFEVLASAGFDVAETPYEGFLERYFARSK